MSVVLIVDDSPADRALFRTVLQRAGFTVHEVARGAEALPRAREVRPHALILDLNLTDSDGLDVCRAFKADHDLRALPVLMLTVRDNDRDVLAGLEAGADDYVAKDSAPEIVLARVRRLIQFRQLATVAVLNEQLVQVGRLLAGIVHEIRGPLAVIRGSAELMRLQLDSCDPSHQWIDPILRNAQLLQVRLEHLMAAVRSGPAALERVAVEPILREAAELFLKGTDPRGCQLTIETTCAPGLPAVHADGGRLIQVVLALLGNAHEAVASVKSKGRVTLRAATVVDEGRDWLTVEVADDGPGIAEAILDRIFEPFVTSKEKGSGYGLYLASEILKEHGGRLTACNPPRGGACLTIWLPAATDEAPDGAKSPD